MKTLSTTYFNTRNTRRRRRIKAAKVALTILLIVLGCAYLISQQPAKTVRPALISAQEGGMYAKH